MYRIKILSSNINIKKIYDLYGLNVNRYNRRFIKYMSVLKIAKKQNKNEELKRTLESRSRFLIC